MSIRLFWRRGLLVLAGAGTLAVAAPAVASAATTLTLNPTSVPAASTSTHLEFQYTFSPATSNVTTELPPGLLANGTIGTPSGACLLTPASDTPSAGCQVGSGMVNGSTAVTLYLVQAPSASDLAGVEMFIAPGVHPVGAVDVRPADGGLNLVFSSLPVAASAIDVTFTDLRMPTSCPSTPANVTVTADSGNVSTPLTVTGCSSLAYSPDLSATVKKDASDSGAEVVSTITQAGAASESATKAETLNFGTSLSPNTAAVAACFVTACNVGTASATSPLLPSAAFSGGTVSLGGTITAPTLTITFPLVHLTLVGMIDLLHNSVTFSPLPDFPISMLAVDVTGPNGQKAFTTSCQAATLVGTFTPWDGNAAVTKTANIDYAGTCPVATVGKPTASGSLKGLGNRHPKLKFKVTHGSNAPNIKSVSIGPSQGLSFRKCIKKGKKHLCSGVSVSGGTVKSEKISGGRLTIVMKSAASSVSVKVVGPAIAESKSLQTEVNKHKIKTISFTIKVKDASGKTTKVLLKLKA